MHCSFRTLISGADLILSFGRRFGLVGRNGIGKTTLLRMLAGRQLQIPSHLTVLHVEQEVEGDDTLALDSVLECDTKRHSLLQEEKQITAQLQTATGYYRISYFDITLLRTCIITVSQL